MGKQAKISDLSKLDLTRCGLPHSYVRVLKVQHILSQHLLYGWSLHKTFRKKLVTCSNCRLNGEFSQKNKQPVQISATQWGFALKKKLATRAYNRQERVLLTTK